MGTSMEKKIIFMFSGQGSQYYHMGKELYESYARFKFWMDHCDEIARPLLQESLIDILYRGRDKREPFDQIVYTNPALLSIQYSLFRILVEMGIQPDFLLGYSLGEITASVISGGISLEKGLQFIVAKAELFEKKAQPAEMLAIVDSQEMMTEFPEFFQNCWLTGKNFQKSFVVSGLPEDIRRLQEKLTQTNSVFQKLPVKFGFHTELIDSVEDDFKQLVRKFKMAPLRIPVISSLRSEIIQDVNADYLWDVIRHPVDFEKTISWTLEEGDRIYIDVGPSGTLATFVKYILTSDSGSLSLQMINQFGRDQSSMEILKRSLPAGAYRKI